MLNSLEVNRNLLRYSSEVLQKFMKKSTLKNSNSSKIKIDKIYFIDDKKEKRVDT